LVVFVVPSRSSDSAKYAIAHGLDSYDMNFSAEESVWADESGSHHFARRIRYAHMGPAPTHQRSAGLPINPDVRLVSGRALREETNECSANALVKD
jgi:hypothetical protein